MKTNVSKNNFKNLHKIIIVISENQLSNFFFQSTKHFLRF